MGVGVPVAAQRRCPFTAAVLMILQILLLPAFSASSHAKSNHENRTPGWWENMIGHGAPIDTRYVHCLALSC